MPLGRSTAKQTADVPNERPGSEKESSGRQQEALGKSRGRRGKGSALKQSERALDQNEATKWVPQEVKHWNTDERW